VFTLYRWTIDTWRAADENTRGVRCWTINTWRAADGWTRHVAVEVCVPRTHEAYKGALAVCDGLLSIGRHAAGWGSDRAAAGRIAGARLTSRFRHTEHPAEQDAESEAGPRARRVNRRTFLHLP
jgi:hypothetical protein